jgi:hypothetical protein
MTKKYKRTKSIKGKKNITDTHGPVHVLVCVLSLLNVVCLMCAMYVGIYFCVDFWSYNS